MQAHEPQRYNFNQQQQEINDQIGERYIDRKGEQSVAAKDIECYEQKGKLLCQQEQEYQDQSQQKPQPILQEKADGGN